MARPFLIRPIGLLPSVDPEAEDRYAQQQSHDLLKLLRAKLAASTQVNPGATPEAVATDVFMYMSGLADGIIRTAPDLADALAEQIETSMCDAATGDAELITWSQLLEVMPELANPRSFDCLFSKHPKEEAVLWFGMEAWQASRLPKPEALASIEQSAQDARTKLRLLSEQERTVAIMREAERAAQLPGVAPHPTGPQPPQNEPSVERAP